MLVTKNVVISMTGFFKNYNQAEMQVWQAEYGLFPSEKEFIL